jgi:hypothetical protein
VRVLISSGVVSHFLRVEHSGTGASAVYPLLICALEPTWTMVATGESMGYISNRSEIVPPPDIDSISLSYARANVHFNDLEDRVKILRVDETGPKFPALGRYARPHILSPQLECV